MNTRLPLGPLMIDIAGLQLSDLEQERLCHPLVGGLILFARNYASPQQLEQLTAAVHALRSPALPIAIDHEGGRVQRCRDGFTRLPAMRRLGEQWDRDPQAAWLAARGIGYVLAAELRARGVDLSFTPVLDLDWGRSSVIGDRSLHANPVAVVRLAGALIEGLHRAGMAACGKHFPGHGWVEADSHVALPVDERELEELAPDIEPYRRLELDAVMPAHVIYRRLDPRPAGFSRFWTGMLRNQLGFNGVIFSDDLSMAGASVAGGICERCTAAWDAGCDLLLVCNSPDAVGELLANWQPPGDPLRSQRVERLVPTSPAVDWTDLQQDWLYWTGVATASSLLA
ncbi:MAG TPA: beta-N-acetylhexosaminidase [Accumulibacter sp.]|uniref:Beta-hexosaminidase n=2 Tax=Candidatus Accumulibacter TaxID=327159 RepID=A0A7D5N949_9PROT|nr:MULTISPECIES: beta-N-acetylhexosaminidase [Candidatus Accumulibacter]QLH49575.1 MAG: beta-N-acetylhexosaminidase [Candidatus Accumulibacter cognatus]MBL8400664.1 beta-N-acetylhexosaminidase [Accumulibacter sp.]MCC2867662.1 beta-N-acetylhexosaminidase [Candidatus Accumulibacter phosphatis]TMQ76234.1 Beta N-acetyl-glucosaminidase [Candidatus Accumulibacter phosphatis]HMW55445.1 beta-N-acetylhexosaminidase [Accumulibacter sp.]